MIVIYRTRTQDTSKFTLLSYQSFCFTWYTFALLRIICFFLICHICLIPRLKSLKTALHFLSRNGTDLRPKWMSVALNGQLCCSCNRLIEKIICYLSKVKPETYKSIPKIDILDLSPTLTGNKKRREAYGQRRWRMLLSIEIAFIAANISHLQSRQSRPPRSAGFFLPFFAAVVTKRPVISLYDSGQAIRQVRLTKNP